MKDPLKGREVIFELRPIGNIMKVVAMDTESMTEITIQGPVSAGDEILKANALKKLEFMLKKKGVIA